MTHSWTSLSRLVVGLCFLLNMLDGADVVILSFIAPELSVDWKISPAQLGVVFSASLAGMAIGCLGVAPLADRFGRRKMILVSFAVAGATMIASGFCATVPQLLVARLLIGVGVGTVGVCMSAMAAEFAPAHHRAFAVGFVQAGWPFAAVITALVAATVVPLAGWRPMLIGIGALSLLLVPVLARLLPESAEFLRDRAPGTTGGAFRLATLFDAERRRASICLWLAVALGYFALYFVINWIPKLTADAGLAPAQAIYAGATLNAGAFVGTSLNAALAVRWPVRLVIAVFYAGGVGVLMLFGSVQLPLLATLATAFVIGVAVQGGFNGFWGLAAMLYPAAIRGTGIGWALGVGRIGAVLGPIAGGLLVDAQVSGVVLFGVYALALVAAAALCLAIPGASSAPARQ